MNIETIAKTINEIAKRFNLNYKASVEVIHENLYSNLLPDRTEADLDEEETQFYEQLGDYCYEASDCINRALELMESPYGLNHKDELRIIIKNLGHISDRLENVWGEYAES